MKRLRMLAAQETDVKIAVAGKGGVGKTTLAGTLARSFAARGWDVLAIDADDDPNLGVAVGVAPDEVRTLPEDFVREADTPEGQIPYELVKAPAEIITTHASTGPDGVTLLTAGPVDAGSGGFTLYHVTVRLLLASLEEGSTEVTIVDLPNGYEHFGLGTAIDADVLVGVVEPSYGALETGQRTTEFARQLLPAAVAEALTFDEPDLDAVDVSTDQ